MNHMMLIVRSAALQCARFTALYLLTLRGLASTLQINSYAHLWISRVRHALNAGVIHMFDTSGTLQARAHQGLTPGRRRVARGVALVIGISMSMPMSAADNGSRDAIYTLRELADIQLTEKQEACHNYIVHRESSFRADARNGSHHGYYQGRTTYLINKPDDVQFYWYWTYVSSRYGVTEYDEPDMCKAALHLKTRNWQ